MGWLKQPSETRILLAEETQFVSDKLRDALLERGFQVKLATSGAEACDIMRDWRPHFALYDMVMPDLMGPLFLKRIKDQLADGRHSDGRTRVFMMSSHNSMANVKECLKMGASDYLVKPVKLEALISRIVLHLQEKRQVSELRAGDLTDADRALRYMHMTDLLLRESLKPIAAPILLHNLVGMLGLATEAVRVSVIEGQVDAEHATVRASSDKKDIDGLKLELSKYPEVLFVLNSEKTLALDNLREDAQMSAISDQTKSISFNAMIVCPIHVRNEIWGVVSVRLSDAKKALSDFDIRFAQLTTHVVAHVITREILANSGSKAA